MNAKDFLSGLRENIESNLRLARELDKSAEDLSPRCGECGERLTDEEIKERKEGGVNLFDKDTICNDCFTDFVNRKENR